MKLTIHLTGLIAAMVLVALAGGCAPFQPATAPAQKAAGDSAAVDTAFDQILADIDGVFSLVPQSVRPVLLAAQKTAAQGKASNLDGQVQLGKVIAHDQAMTAKVDVYDNSILGGKGNRWKWGIIIGFGLAGLVGLAAVSAGTIATGGAGSGLFVGALMTVGHALLSFWWFIGHGISAIFAEVFRRRSIQQATGAVLQSVGVAANHAGQPVVAMPATSTPVAAIAAPIVSPVRVPTPAPAPGTTTTTAVQQTTVDAPPAPGSAGAPISIMGQ